MDRLEVNIISGNCVDDKDLSVVFGDIDGNIGGTVIRVEPNTHMSNILKDLGIFQSSSQARKSGWDFTLPEGFTHYPKIGKKRHEITIWNPTE